MDGLQLTGRRPTAREKRQEEQTEEGDRLQDRGLRNLWRFMRFSLPYWPWLAIGFVAGLARMVLPLYLPRFVKEVLDGALAPFAAGSVPAEEAVQNFKSLLPLLAGLMAMHAFATLGRFYLPNIAANNAIRDIRYFLFRHLQRLSLAFHTRRPSGAIVARIMSDVGAAQIAMDLVLIQVSQQALTAVVIAGFLLISDWQWALVSFATLPIFGVTTYLLRRPMRRASRKQRETVEKMSGRVQERFSMIKEVQAFTAESLEQRRVRREVEELKKYTLRQQLLSGLLQAASEITRILGLVVVLSFGVYRVIYGDATTGEVMAFYLYLGLLLQPVALLTTLYTQMHVAAAAADRVFEFFDSEPEIKDSPGAVPFTAKCPAVKLDNVSFSYPTDNPQIVLHDIDLEAKTGWRVALVGESGSGKSTLLGLLPRFYDVQQGRVLIDGRDAREYNVRSLRQAIGIVPQEPVLFAGTVRENISYGRRDATEDEIQEAAQQANAHQFIKHLRYGYDTIVGERGIGLSGGQIQRIAIARAFLKDPAVLILDEATSNLDATSEALVLEAIERLAEGRTTFIIAHRLSTARTADMIVVLQDGVIQEKGSHKQLIELDGMYARLWRRQMGGPESWME